MLMIYLTSLLFVNTCVMAKSKLIELTDDNWMDMLEGEWMVKFFATWCPACTEMKTNWEEFSTWSDDLDISVAEVDVTANPGLSGRFMVTALPTVYHVKNGVFRKYRGSKDKNELMSFIEDKKWEEVEEISIWKSPVSYHMAVVAQFFKLSMVLRNAHTTLVEEYKFPVIASLAVFGFVTLLIGALLGLILVCVIDFIFPPKMASQVDPDLDKKLEPKDADEEDLVEEAIEKESEKEVEENADKNEDMEVRKRTKVAASE